MSSSRRVAPVVLGLITMVAVATPSASAGSAPPGAASRPAARIVNCSIDSSLCTEVFDSELFFGQGHYRGHDEPAMLFYSNTPGAGNDNTYLLRLPKDPPLQPVPDGTGATWNFQQHAAIWFGMAMCDDQSAPGPMSGNAPCVPDSDTNIFNDADPNSPHYVGKHPGTAFMELQFYPPGWATSCDATKWCAALTVDSAGLDLNHGVSNNAACINADGTSSTVSVNTAIVTLNGRATTPANPIDPNRGAIDPARDLFLNSGDVVAIHLFDTPAGFKAQVDDLTAGVHGAMTASAANGFAQIAFEPTSTTCHTITTAFHPMYSTSSENTRIPWAAHSFNISFSDEIGHFEYCGAADPTSLACTRSAGTEPLDADDNTCANPSDSLLVQIGGCTGDDTDFDGVAYQKTWPGSGNTRPVPQPVLFTSPLTHGLPFQRAGFETDIPAIERGAGQAPACDQTTGTNCVNPPPGAAFYPIFTTRDLAGGLACAWQEGGANIPGTTNTFGGTSVAEYGQLLPTVFPGSHGPRFLNRTFRQVLPNNPCTIGPNPLSAATTVK